VVPLSFLNPNIFYPAVFNLQHHPPNSFSPALLLNNFSPVLLPNSIFPALFPNSFSPALLPNSFSPAVFNLRLRNMEL